MRGETACRTAEMPAHDGVDETGGRERPHFVGYEAGRAEPSTTDRCSSLPSTPLPELISSAASWAHSSHDGPKIPAEPCSGITSTTLTANPMTTHVL